MRSKRSLTQSRRQRSTDEGAAEVTEAQLKFNLIDLLIFLYCYFLIFIFMFMCIVFPKYIYVSF